MADDKPRQQAPKKMTLSALREEALKLNQIVSGWKAGVNDPDTLEALLTLERALGSILVEVCDRASDLEAGVVAANKRLTGTVDALEERVAALEARLAAPAAEAVGGEGEAAGNGQSAPAQVAPPVVPGPGPGNIVASVTIKP